MISTTFESSLKTRYRARLEKRYRRLAQTLASMDDGEWSWAPEDGLPRVIDHIQAIRKAQSECRRILCGQPPVAGATPGRNPPSPATLRGELERDHRAIVNALVGDPERSGCGDGRDVDFEAAVFDFLATEASHHAAFVCLLRLLDPERILPIVE